MSSIQRHSHRCPTCGTVSMPDGSANYRCASTCPGSVSSTKVSTSCLACGGAGIGWTDPSDEKKVRDSRGIYRYGFHRTDTNFRFIGEFASEADIENLRIMLPQSKRWTITKL